MTTPFATDRLTPLDRGLLAGQAAVEAQGRVQADLIDDLREVLDEHKGRTTSLTQISGTGS